MIHKKIENLIPYVSENFITYPLWEEGKYIPFLNFWQKCETDGDFVDMQNRLTKVFHNTAYDLEYTVENNYSNTIHSFQVYPKFKELKNGSYKYEKKDWSIEEMLDLLNLVIN